MNSDVNNEILALGRVAIIGEFYDARNEKFLGLSVFNEQPDTTLIISTETPGGGIKFIMDDTFKEKFNKLNVTGELKLSILTDLINLGGHAKYFKSKKSSNHGVKVSLFNSVKTYYDNIMMNYSKVKSLINWNTFERINATHIVIGIQWGGNVLISLEETSTIETDDKNVKGSLQAVCKKLMELLEIDGNCELDSNRVNDIKLNKFSFELFGDILPDETAHTLEEALRIIKLAPTLIKKSNGGKGNPISYTLISINQLRQMWDCKTNKEIIAKRIDEETIKRFVTLFDNINSNGEEILKFHNDVIAMEAYLDKDKIKNVKELYDNYNSYEARVRQNLSECLERVRSGDEPVNKLNEVFQNSISDQFAPENFPLLLKGAGKLKNEVIFIQSLLELNVSLINKHSSLQQFQWKHMGNDIYILFYNYDNTKSTLMTINMFRNMLDDKENFGNLAIFAAADYTILDATNFTMFEKLIQTTQISCLKHGKVFIEDYHHNDNRTSNTLASNWTVHQLQNKVMEIEKCPLPIGFIYTQLPKEKSPMQMWPNSVWHLISDYAGLFFRAEGGDSLKFGEEQPASSGFTNIASILKNMRHESLEEPLPSTTTLDGEWCDDAFIVRSCKHLLGLKFYEDDEIWPTNMAVRLWKRVE